MKRESKIAVLAGVFLLGIAFVALRLAGLVEWDWVVVLSPFWVPNALIAVLAVVAVLGSLADKAVMWLVK